MGLNKSKPTDNSSAVSTQRMNFRLVQNVLLVWLDSNIDNHDADYHNTLTKLHQIFHTINTYTDVDQCLEFLQTITNDKVCMIISGALGQHVVPQLHHMAQVDSIFIFCFDKQKHEQWAKEWFKIKGVFTNVTPICEALKKASELCERDAMPISFMATTDDMSKKELDQLEPSFMYSKILKEILLSIPFGQKQFQQFIKYYHKVLSNKHDQIKLGNELNIAKELEMHYNNKTPIWWYTYPCFLYTMLNRALRLMDADTIVHMGFFINDLHRHIKKLHKRQFSAHRSRSTFIVYRGQGLSATQFKQLSKTKGGLLSFNSFLSTSKNREISLRFTQEAMRNVDTVGVLFVMIIKPSKSTTPFASINKVSYFEDKEDEVLFSMHTVFRIGEIRNNSENAHLFEVELTLTNDDDENLRQLTDRIRSETSSDGSGWFGLCSLLLKIGQASKAQEVYEILLEGSTDENERRKIYNGLGTAHTNQGCYQEAIIFYEKSLAIEQQLLPSNHPDLATSYNNIGLAYYNMGDYAKALSSYKKAWTIHQRSLPVFHPSSATWYNNIGLVYSNMGDYEQALSSYEISLAIYQQSLSPNHPSLAASYNNIGSVYDNMGDYAKALSFYEKSLEMRQQSLPPNHPDLATSYSNIGSVYFNMGDYAKAFSFYEKSLAIHEQSLPPNHPNLATSYNNIGSMYFNMGDYAKAFSFYEKSLEMRQQSLPPNHPSLAISYNNIGAVHDKMNDHAKALWFYEQAAQILQQILPPNHPQLQELQSILEIVKKKLSAKYIPPELNNKMMI